MGATTSILSLKNRIENACDVFLSKKCVSVLAALMCDDTASKDTFMLLYGHNHPAFNKKQIKFLRKAKLPSPDSDIELKCQVLISNSKKSFIVDQLEYNVEIGTKKTIFSSLDILFMAAIFPIFLRTTLFLKLFTSCPKKYFISSALLVDVERQDEKRMQIFNEVNELCDQVELAVRTSVADAVASIDESEVYQLLLLAGHALDNVLIFLEEFQYGVTLLSATKLNDKHLFRIIYSNNAFANLSGYKREEITGRNYDFAFAESASLYHQESLRKSLLTKTKSRFAISFTRGDGLGTVT